MTSILNGAYDLHIHTAPDVASRRLDDLDMAARCRELGMKGFAIKCHQFQSAGRAALVRKEYPGINAVGGITLNNSVGGLNPMAIEMAARMGAKIVWFPTVNSLYQKRYLERTGEARPYGAGGESAVEIKDIAVLEDAPGGRSSGYSGQFAKGVMEVLDAIKQFDLVLATGHIDPLESLALFRAGREMGLKRMIATHVSFPMTFFTDELQKEALSQGAMLEHTAYTPFMTPESFEIICHQIRMTGPENVFLSSDFGQASSPDPAEGLAAFAVRLIEEGGFRENDVRRMLCGNPASMAE